MGLYKGFIYFDQTEVYYQDPQTGTAPGAIHLVTLRGNTNDENEELSTWIDEFFADPSIKLVLNGLNNELLTIRAIPTNSSGIPLIAADNIGLR